MNEPLIWVDEVRSPSNVVKVTDNADGTKSYERAGELIQKGTNQSSFNFNKMTTAEFENGEIVAVLVQEIKQHQRKIRDFDGQIIDVELNNTLEYPFNNSTKTIAIDNKDTTNYHVVVELLEDVPNTGELIVTDKLLNGFKIHYTGSAMKVKVRCYVIGDMCFYG